MTGKWQPPAPSLELPMLDNPACADTIDPDVFFTKPLTGRPGPDRYDPAARAKLICRSCPEQVPCLDYALRQQIPHGIWGGVDENARRKMLRRRAA